MLVLLELLHLLLRHTLALHLLLLHLMKPLQLKKLLLRMLVLLLLLVAKRSFLRHLHLFLTFILLKLCLLVHLVHFQLPLRPLGLERGFASFLLLFAFRLLSLLFLLQAEFLQTFPFLFSFDLFVQIHLRQLALVHQFLACQRFKKNDRDSR